VVNNFSQNKGIYVWISDFQSFFSNLERVGKRALQGYPLFVNKNNPQKEHPKKVGAGGAIRARDLCDQGTCPLFSPDYESGALARLGYPGPRIAAVF
jgi:hypothetical protein